MDSSVVRAPARKTRDADTIPDPGQNFLFQFKSYTSRLLILCAGCFVIILQICRYDVKAKMYQFEIRNPSPETVPSQVISQRSFSKVARDITVASTDNSINIQANVTRGCEIKCNECNGSLLWSRGNISTSHAAGPGLIPGRVNLLVEVFPGFSLNRKANAGNVGYTRPRVSYDHHTSSRTIQNLSTDGNVRSLTLAVVHGRR